MTLPRHRISILSFWVMLSALANQMVLAQGGPPLITDDPGTPGDGN